jgi:pimeloyl-ACP methyl ester carboxylesterase
MDKTIRYRTSSIFYRVEGKGHPVILLHGFAEDHRIWDHQVDHLKKDFCVITPDFPGSASSDPITGPPANLDLLTMGDYADCIKAVADAEQINAFTMIGHSMGGYAGLAFAEKYPASLKAFGLFHSTAYPDTPEKKTAREKSIEFMRQHGSSPFIGQSVPNLFSENFKKQHPEIVNDLIERYANFNPESLVLYYKAMIQRPDRTLVLKEFPHPVLFIIGGQDKAVSLQDSLQQSYMPQLSYIHIIETAAHMGMLEDTLYSNNILESFLKQALLQSL